MAYKSPSEAIIGKISLSILVGLEGILLIILVLKQYSPALIRSPTHSNGFSIKSLIFPFYSYKTYLKLNLPLHILMDL
jgi:hypothetical protein